MLPVPLLPGLHEQARVGPPALPEPVQVACERSDQVERAVKNAMHHVSRVMRNDQPGEAGVQAVLRHAAVPLAGSPGALPPSLGAAAHERLCVGAGRVRRKQVHKPEHAAPVGPVEELDVDSVRPVDERVA